MDDISIPIDEVIDGDVDWHTMETSDYRLATHVFPDQVFVMIGISHLSNYFLHNYPPGGEIEYLSSEDINMENRYEDILYLRHWVSRMDAFLGDRTVAPGFDSQSNLSKHMILKPNGFEINYDRVIRLWTALVANAGDLSHTPAPTFISYEALARFCCTNYKWVQFGMKELTDLGFVEKSRRYNATNRTFLHLVPVPLADWDQEHKRSLIVLDARRGGKSSTSRKGSKSGSKFRVSSKEVDYTYECFSLLAPDHSDFSTIKLQMRLRGYIKRCIATTEDVGLFRGVIAHVFMDESERGQQRLANVCASDNLGAYLQKCFPIWLAEYQTAMGLDPGVMESDEETEHAD